MKVSIILAALVGSALAAPAPAPAPAPQDIDFDAIIAEIAAADVDLPLGPSVTTTSESVPVIAPSTADIIEDLNLDSTSSRRLKSRSLAARAACSPQTSKNTDQTLGSLGPEEWKAAIALKHPATNPATVDSYKKVFDGWIGSIKQKGYRGTKTFATYDINACKAECDKKPYCLAFNLFAERDPAVNPGVGCEDPASLTNYKCTLYSLPFTTTEAADNLGQWRNKFRVVIGASVGYVKPFAPADPPGYEQYGPILDKAINAPLLPVASLPPGAPTKYQNTLADRTSYPTTTVPLDYYDPGVCAVACDETAAYKSRHPDSEGWYKSVASFNFYILVENGKAQGFTCQCYSSVWDPVYAVNGGNAAGTIKVANAVLYKKIVQPAGPALKKTP
ncbi:hypothetical protein DRE_00449 [Drechslerella stenobrocha 248]|uniref:Apple domain-containing protein n=1 Tax=Drechslerella stenobrocha 248 TaxID=1043628 RepID=W7HTN8_9PEZI|nr:hypothetical protein DRE_00449 [Drechslerella stenobrocha 248]